ncbi:TetR/AcrR family transcriptional regulator [Jannaschia sp. R86511]|uniref:TetR/AcrR family transcriptional regulator n=1 Tax=Jannaschia sp. R86511 TaxID=3093853 RepID=UPI0036D37406
MLLRSALHVLGTSGWHGLTHRAVEQHADVPHGSTVYYFGSRDGLVDALVDHICTADVEDWTAARADLAATLARQEDPTGDLVDLLTRQLVSDRARLLARYELFLEGARRPDLARHLTERGLAIRQFLVPVVTALGSTDSTADSDLLAALLDGLLLHELVGPPATAIEERRDLASAIARTLRAVVPSRSSEIRPSSPH